MEIKYAHISGTMSDPGRNIMQETLCRYEVHRSNTAVTE